jgi:hypothetical protein
MIPTFADCRVWGVFCVLGMLVTAAESQDRKSTGELHVLFIGNSFTYANDLPKMVAELAKAGKQRPLRYDQETPGGCLLERHWQDGKALAKIQSRKWDCVVLQEQSQVPLLRREAMFDYGKRFNGEITKHGAKTILYMTWAVQDKPDDQSAITRAYEELGNELKAKVAPVGKAWEMALKARPRVVLHGPDKKHPAPAGTYLAACVFYAAIYGKSPEGLPGKIARLPDDEARQLQVIAWKAVQAQDKSAVP